MLFSSVAFVLLEGNIGELNFSVLLRDHIGPWSETFGAVHDLVSVLLFHLLHSTELIAVVPHAVLSIARSRTPTSIASAAISLAFQVSEFVSNLKITSVQLSFKMHCHTLVGIAAWLKSTTNFTHHHVSILFDLSLV
jgi:hypothetical protein